MLKMHYVLYSEVSLSSSCALCSEHHASLVREREAVRRAHSESQRAYQQSLQSGEEDNGKVCTA